MVPAEGVAVLDLLFVALGAGFLLSCAGYATLCEWM